MSTQLRILLVDDDAGVLHAVQRILRSPGLMLADGPRLHIEAFAQPSQALARAAVAPFDLAVVDYRMPDMDGVQLLQRLRELQPRCSRVILTGTADLACMAAAINEARIERYIAKPWDDWQLLAVLSDLMSERAAAEHQARLARLARDGAKSASAIERERQRLEQLEPGITHVEFSPDGAVLLDWPDSEPDPDPREARHAP